MRRYLIACAAAAAVTTGAASADIIEEVRLGVMQHNICVLDCDNADKEDGPDINGEIVFASPGFLKILWSPRPIVVGSVNTAGNTSFGGAGLQWGFEFADGWTFEPSVSYVIHDGELHSPYPQGDPRGDAFTEEHVLLGSRDLFRTSFAVHRQLTDTWGMELMYEHLSHGQILGNGRNQGMDSLGLRVSYSFE